MRFVKVSMGGGCMESVRRAVALEREKYRELYRRFRERYPLPTQLIQQAMNQGVEIGKSLLALKKDGRVHKPRPKVRRISIRFAKDSWRCRKTAASAAPVKIAASLPGGRREAWRCKTQAPRPFH